MSNYMKLGQVPRKRHIKHARDPETSFRGEGIAYEHVVTTAGFDRAYSITYHLRPPTRVKQVELAGYVNLEEVKERPLKHQHIKTQDLGRSGDPIRNRIPLLFNEDVTCSRARPSEAQKTLYRNGGADEVIFVYDGKGTLQTPYGKLPYRQDDYIVIPRGTTYRVVPDDSDSRGLPDPRITQPVRIAAPLSQPRRTAHARCAVLRARFPRPSRAAHHRQGGGHRDSRQRRPAADSHDRRQPPVRRRRLGRLHLPVHVQRDGFRTADRHGAPPAAVSADV